MRHRHHRGYGRDKSKSKKKAAKRKQSPYNRFVKHHMKGGKMTMKQVARLWKAK